MASVALGTPEPEDQNWSELFALKKDEPPPHDKSQLPWGLPRRDPDVAGTIILIQQSQELPEHPNLITRIISLLRELIWLFSHDSMRREEERMQVTTVRVRCSSDEKRDARLIGSLRGANLTLGDNVWFWGWHYKGSLIVRKGYNWTTKAIVSARLL
jgi:translation initiation factor IF-1